MSTGENRTPDIVRLPDQDGIKQITDLTKATTEDLVAERDRLSDIEIVPYSKEREEKIRARIDQIQHEIANRVFKKDK